MTSSYILSGCRTPIGKLMGALSSLTAPQLGAVAIAESLKRAGINSAAVDEVIMGLVLSAGLGQAPARQAALSAGLPPTVAAFSVNKVCGSGLKAIMLADQAIRAGEAQCIVAGGMESMSRAPFLASGARAGWKFGHQWLIDSMIHDGLWCAAGDESMGQLAEALAARHRISRQDQDTFSAESHRRAIAADKVLREQIVPVSVPGQLGDRNVDRDEGPRRDTSIEALSRLPPAFAEDGTVTSGNASQISDGAAAVVVTDSPLARKSSTPLKARIVASATTGVAPQDVFTAPVSAVQRVLAKADMKLGDIDLLELNEAFACQCLACVELLGIDRTKLNVHGGAIALGHPIGASGSRIMVALLHALAARQQRFGLAVLCLGGGNAVAIIVHRESD